MPIEVTSYTKSDLDKELVVIEAIERSEVPTRLVRGKEHPINLANYKRKLRKQAINVHQQKLLVELVAVAVDAGFLSADGRVESGRLVVYKDGLPTEGDV